MSTKEERRDQHEAINSLSHYQVAKIVRAYFPKLPASQINKMARTVISTAHALISPKE